MVGPELPTMSWECRHQAGGRLFQWDAFCREGIGDRESHQGTKGKQGNTRETRDGRNHSTS